MAEVQESLQSSVMGLEHTMRAMQQQLKSNTWGRTAASAERGSSLRVAAIQPSLEDNTTQYNAIHRMELPVFNGEEARTWIRRCTRYFQLIPIPEEQKVSLASVYMQGRAELWFQVIWKKEAEVRARKEKNLCYKCDEPYNPGHRCRMRQVHMLLIEDEAKTYEEGEEPLEEVTEEENAIVAVYAMGASVNSQTLKINGKVNGKEIHILIDSGSTHCFIEEKVVQVLGCGIEPATPMTVRVANGERVVSSFICPSFCWEMQGYQFSHPVRVLKLGGYDCVLGYDWLITKNPIRLDFHQLQVTITEGSKKVVLKTLDEKGDLRTLSAYSLSRLLSRGAYVVKGQLYTTSKKEPMGENDPRLLGLLQQFQDIFQEPRNLPPERSIEHSIELMPDAIPRKQHPYRYAYGQKQKLRRLLRRCWTVVL
ncbi:UNVERIFIED_CONTAM: hypothetical protein Sradi_1765700 [Sesamum radiatum]|uniref:Uncharacterized protein n=1 Tax=Sesamum radiatum TaxID=300843 RepID=A0AAW2TTI8_SESRA